MMTQVEFDQAVENWTKAWQKGDPRSCYFLGRLCFEGDGVPKDEAKAVEIWSKVDAFWPKAFVGKWKRR